MKVKLEDVFLARESLGSILEAKDAWLNELAAKIGIRIARMAKKLRGELQLIEERRNNLVKKYGVENDKGIANVPIELEDGTPNPDFEKFSDEFKELLEEDTEVGIKKVELPEDAKVPMKVLLELEPFITVHTVD